MSRVDTNHGIISKIGYLLQSLAQPSIFVLILHLFRLFNSSYLIKMVQVKHILTNYCPLKKTNYEIYNILFIAI
jgi:hypothetical protein